MSQRREGANRLYVSLLVGLVVLVAALLRFGIGDVSEDLVLGSIGILGVLLSASWILVIRSYRQLNTEKYRVLTALEEHLVYRFYKLEWDPKSEGRKSNRYWQLTKTEMTLPATFCVMFAGLVAYSFLR